MELNFSMSKKKYIVAKHWLFFWVWDLDLVSTNHIEKFNSLLLEPETLIGRIEYFCSYMEFSNIIRLLDEVK